MGSDPLVGDVYDHGHKDFRENPRWDAKRRKKRFIKEALRIGFAIKVVYFSDRICDTRIGLGQ